MSKLRDDILTFKKSSQDYLKTKYSQWDTYESLFHNILIDQISKDGKSQVFDPKLSTLIIERSYRVMSQLATGKAKAISKNDIGTSMLMDLIVDKYVNPNANAQFDLLTKFRMVDMYSNVYGIFYTLVDWDVKKNGYIGPDIWLLPIRDVFPQPGSMSPDDSEKMIIRTWKPFSYFERIAKQKREGYKNLDKIIIKLKEKSGDKSSRDQEDKSQREQDQYPVAEEAKQKGYFEVLSQYEGDRWVDFCTAADEVFRDTENPNKDGEIPVVAKHSIPLIDDPSGMGDMERGYSMQMATNSNWNLYFDGLKMTQAPPILINKDAIAVPSSIQAIPGAKWMLRTGQAGVQGAASALQLNPRGIESFNNTYNVLNAALQNLFGTSNTDVSQNTDQTLGKTPQALKMQQMRENTRDNADRFFMEQYVKKVYKKFVNLISRKQSSAITIRLFDKEIQELARNFPEIKEMYDEKTGKLTIDKKRTGSTLYDWEIVSGSTFTLDQKAQLDNIQEYIALYLKSQGPQGNLLKQSLAEEGYDFRFGELFKKGISNSGIQDWDKILVEKTPQETTDDILGRDAQQFQVAMQQIMNGGTPVPPQVAQQPQPVQPPVVAQNPIGGMNGQ